MSTSTRHEVKIVVLCDFDGTMTLDDTTDGILAECAYDEWLEIEARWKSNEISAQECMEQQTICIRERQLNKLTEYLRAVEIDPEFEHFAHFCIEHTIRLVIESDGYDYAIRSVLERCDLAGLPIRSNKLIQFVDDSFRLEFPYLSKGCAATIGTCKCEIARRECSRKWSPPLPLIVIGNDRTDQCVANRADYVFARDIAADTKGELSAFCERKTVAYESFMNFGFALNRLTEWIHSDHKFNGTRGVI